MPYKFCIKITTIVNSANALYKCVNFNELHFGFPLILRILSFRILKINNGFIKINVFDFSMIFL